jgi:hypothetical protein
VGILTTSNPLSIFCLSRIYVVERKKSQENLLNFIRQDSLLAREMKVVSWKGIQEMKGNSNE